MVDILKMTSTLTITAAMGGLLIGITYQQTLPRREHAIHLRRQSAVHRVLPPNSQITECKGIPPLPPVYWQASSEGRVVGYAFRDSTIGYRGEIQIVMGVEPKGTILGLHIISQKETPGLGGRIEEILATRPLWQAPWYQVNGNPWFCQQFTGLDILKRLGIEKGPEWHSLDQKTRRNLRSRNLVTAISGATQSTSHVVRCASQSIPRYLEHLNRTEGTRQ